MAEPTKADIQKQLEETEAVNKSLMGNLEATNELLTEVQGKVTVLEEEKALLQSELKQSLDGNEHERGEDQLEGLIAEHTEKLRAELEQAQTLGWEQAEELAEKDKEIAELRKAAPAMSFTAADKKAIARVVELANSGTGPVVLEASALMMDKLDIHLLSHYNEAQYVDITREIAHALTQLINRSS